jgi:peptidoglycan-associated lipoprotein
MGNGENIMRTRNRRLVWLITILLLGMAAATGCKKKIAAPELPPAPKVEVPPPAPKAPLIAAFSAEPSSIERGQSAVLRWSVENASSIQIDQGVGAVQAHGTRRVFPTDSTTYTLTAGGPGGRATATATVNVTAPPPPPPPPAPPKKTIEERLAEVRDAYFDYDKYTVREDARAALTSDAEALKSILADFPNAVIAVEGHCDERGSAEYNMALGDRRAAAAKELLVQLGVSGDKLKTVSYGKERPQCTESNEACWQKNRRAHLSAGAQ